MKSIFYTLSVIAIGAAGYFGWEAKNNFDQQLDDRNTLIEKNKNLSTNIKQKEKDKEQSTDARDLSLNERAETKAGLEAAVSNEGGLKRTLDDIGTELETVVAEEAQIDKAIDEIKELFPDIELPEVPGKYNEMVDNEKKLVAQVEEAELIKTKLQESIAKNIADSKRIGGKIKEANDRVRGNTFQATVTGVDNDWNFVVIGAGENSVLTSDSTLLVQRGGRYLGKLSVQKIEANSAIADIVPGSLSVGVVLQRGDQVILEKVRSN